MIKEIEENNAEFARPFAQIIEKIRSLEPEINTHIFKILLFEQESTWKKSITDWFLDIGELIVKGTLKPLKTGQYLEFLFNEPFENGLEEYKQSNIYRYCKRILDDDQYKDLFSIYRTQDIPVIEWKEKLRQFYIEVDDYLSKGILDTEMSNYLIERYMALS